ncbi:ATP-binding cassette domain-containing protein [Heyndrickxia oleronia]|uniref:ATP-binding cassette domain-containing protein n=1 Tax=Heyndrickxia oleronia TaxID=38875 RepID=UPI00242EAACE|nr:ATP-binding cassette domain-containing protein [Heyndrickxia oleronia]MCI1591131.1 ATP-binding cassette domain-containing protein [Heyndrickxia oleronia]MCI1614643.1 ATP-binding cassette domain-containing protein [Heyndrickxia oleronia]MCI1745518.1 ATP-binding cassette domain-containing protein [Heyndrickxia oleronia]MCI1762523.1 ATP-binding cassette domain-containing protein [Heyndrickxia oleronia]
MTTVAIEIVGLRKSFGNHEVLSGIDLKVSSGSIFALLGPNGAGKTTLINILSTLVFPDEGSVRVGGYDVATEKAGVKQSISLTGQYAAVDEILTAEENLRMMGRLSGLSPAQSRTRATELLEYFDLVEAAHKKVKTFSGGMRRRLDLAISLVVRRSILFLDEPTTGLDTHSRRALWDIILKLAASGMTIFLTTQYLEEADQLADEIAIIANGRVVAQGSADELKSRIGGEVVEFRNGNDEVIQEFPTDGSIQELKSVLDEYMGHFPENTRINIRKPSMDDVFIDLTMTKQEGSLS